MLAAGLAVYGVFRYQRKSRRAELIDSYVFPLTISQKVMENIHI